MKRSYGTGQLYEKHDAYYGRWRTSDGRKLNRRVGKIREPGTSEGLTRSQAERRFRQMQQDEEIAPRRRADAEVVTVADASASLRRRLAVEGARKSYLEGCESMERVHVVPRLGVRPVHDVEAADVEAIASAMLRRGLKPKTVRNVVTYLHSVFEHAVARGWCTANPVRYASRPKRRRSGDVNPDL